MSLLTPRVIEVQTPGYNGPGGTGDKHYRHVQGSAEAQWVITHGLEKRPAITILTSGGDIVEGSITYDDLNTVTLTFSGAFSGEAYLN